MQNDLYQQVVGATRGEYEVIAELGHAPQEGTAYLARDLTAGGTALLLVPPDAESLDVVGALSDAVPATGGRCTSCGGELATWSAACPHCGRSLAPSKADGPDAAAVAAEAGRGVEIVGAVPHARGGQIFFGRDRIDRRLVAYAARPQGPERFWLDPLWEGEVAPPTPSVTRGFDADSGASRTYGDDPRVDALTNPSAAAGAPSVGVSHHPWGGTYLPPDAGASFGPAADALPAPRRGGRGVLVAAGLGAAVALGGAAWALTRGGGEPTSRIAPTRDTVVARSNAANGAVGSTPPVPVGQRGTDTLTAENADSIRRAQLVERRRVAAERARIAAAARAASDSAVLTIEGDLPSGWVRVANAGGASSERTVPLPPGVASEVVIEAPGYCPDTLHVTLGAGRRQHWSPALRGRPVVGDC